MDKLQAQINDLHNEIELLKRSASIPRDIETAFNERLNLDAKITGTGLSTASTQSISLTGNPQTITVPAQPTGTLTITYKGVTYNLLYK